MSHNHGIILDVIPFFCAYICARNQNDRSKDFNRILI